MRTLRRLSIAILLVLPLLNVITITSSQAAIAPDLSRYWNHYISARWNLAGGEDGVPWTMGQSFVNRGDAWMWAAVSGASSWNVLDGSMTYAWGGVAPIDEPANPPCYHDATNPQPPNQLHSGWAGGGGALAVTYVCAYNGVLNGFQMIVDPTVNWFTDPSPTAGIPSNQYDMQSVIAHEFGHALGWWDFHYSECTTGTYTSDGAHCSVATNPEPTDICGSIPVRSTMCAQIDPGQTYARALSDNDRVVFYGAYPRRSPPLLPASICNFFRFNATDPYALIC